MNGDRFEFGTSGFLYRSNKLMFDEKTQSLWNTERGEPVMGPLSDSDILLKFRSVVTTTWESWYARHPDTSVLSLNTGYGVDYGEGVAYKDYFATDELLFETPFDDDRLANKQEVLALRFAAAPDKQLAIDTEFLQRNSLYTDAIGRQRFVVFTDETGANRVYDPEDTEFVSYDRGRNATDINGDVWRVEEEWLENSRGERRKRLPYHRAFWFGWQAAYPETRLIK